MKGLEKHQQLEKQLIQAVQHLCSILNNPRQGDAFVLDIDDLLLRNPTKKYHGSLLPQLTEKNIPRELKAAMDAGCPIILVTARKEKYRDKTIEQLKELNIPYTELLHAPNDKSAGKAISTKGLVLREYFIQLAAEHREKIKRIIVADDLKDNLTAIEEAFTIDNKDDPHNEMLGAVSLHLYHYKPSVRLLRHESKDFPQTLDDIEIVKKLGGGSESTYLVKDTNNDKLYALKVGVDEKQLQVEVLMNEIYAHLGVPVPAIEAYFTVPKPLAKSLSLEHTARVVQLAEYIDENISEKQNETDVEVAEQAKSHFICHALVGNVDQKRDNYLYSNLDTDDGVESTAIIIDSGCNIIFQALGLQRQDDPYKLMEIDFMRTYKLRSCDWFADLTEAEMTAQARRLIDGNKLNEIPFLISRVGKSLNMPGGLIEKISSVFSSRVDSLVQRFDNRTQLTAKRDKRAIDKQTAAGVLTLRRNDNGELEVLIAKRVRHNWYDNFGGKSDPEDKYLSDTAKREVKEESSGELVYSGAELTRSPFHDLVIIKNGKQYLYRMYIVERQDNIDISKINDKEHTDYQWVPLQAILDELEGENRVTEEGQETIRVNGDFIIFPPLYRMLSQQAVQESLARLVVDNSHASQTLSHDHTLHENSPYKPLVSPEQIQHEVIEALLNKGKVLEEIKEKSKKGFKLNKVPKPNHVTSVYSRGVLVDSKGLFSTQRASFLPRSVYSQTTPSLTVTTTTSSKDTSSSCDISSPVESLSQSELHLKTVVGDEFICENNALQQNVKCFIDKHVSRYERNSKVRENLAKIAVEMISRERANPDRVYVYHGTDDKVSYAYVVYSAIYKRLAADTQHTALRLDNDTFHRCPTIWEFIQELNKKFGDNRWNNNSDGYRECVISTNLFLFGNHNCPTSNTIKYALENSTRREVDLKSLLTVCLKYVGVSDENISKLVKSFDDFPGKGQGMLYQIVLTAEQAEQFTYPAGSLGVENYFTHNEERKTKITDIIRLLKGERLNEKAYIEKLQSRLYTPASEIMEIYSASLTQDQATRLYTGDTGGAISSLLIDDVVRDLLNAVNSIDKTNSLFALTRYLPDTLTQAGCHNNDYIDIDKLVIELAQKGDHKSLEKVLKNKPEYRVKKLTYKSIDSTNRYVLTVKKGSLYSIIKSFPRIEKYSKLMGFADSHLSAGHRIRKLFDLADNGSIKLLSIKLRAVFEMSDYSVLLASFRHEIQCLVNMLSEYDRFYFSLKFYQKIKSYGIKIELNIPCLKEYIEQHGDTSLSINNNAYKLLFNIGVSHRADLAIVLYLRFSSCMLIHCYSLEGTISDRLVIEIAKHGNLSLLESILSIKPEYKTKRLTCETINNKTGEVTKVDKLTLYTFISQLPFSQREDLKNLARHTLYYGNEVRRLLDFAENGQNVSLHQSLAQFIITYPLYRLFENFSDCMQAILNTMLEYDRLCYGLMYHNILKTYGIKLKFSIPVVKKYFDNCGDIISESNIDDVVYELITSEQEIDKTNLLLAIFRHLRGSIPRVSEFIDDITTDSVIVQLIHEADHFTLQSLINIKPEYKIRKLRIKSKDNIDEEDKTLSLYSVVKMRPDTLKNALLMDYAETDLKPGHDILQLLALADKGASAELDIKFAKFIKSYYFLEYFISFPVEMIRLLNTISEYDRLCYAIKNRGVLTEHKEKLEFSNPFVYKCFVNCYDPSSSITDEIYTLLKSTQGMARTNLFLLLCAYLPNQLSPECCNLDGIITDKQVIDLVEQGDVSNLTFIVNNKPEYKTKKLKYNAKDQFGQNIGVYESTLFEIIDYNYPGAKYARLRYFAVQYLSHGHEIRGLLDRADKGPSDLLDKFFIEFIQSYGFIESVETFPREMQRLLNTQSEKARLACVIRYYTVLNDYGINFQFSMPFVDNILNNQDPSHRSRDFEVMIKIFSESLPKSDWYSLAIKYMHITQDGELFLEALAATPENDRFALVQQHLQLINDEQILEKVKSLLNDETKITLQEKYHKLNPTNLQSSTSGLSLHM